MLAADCRLILVVSCLRIVTFGDPSPSVRIGRAIGFYTKRNKQGLFGDFWSQNSKCLRSSKVKRK